ncbi:uncharacterized protein MYCFIDRAFT_209440 [Pseudocercospora fijiensis CIRAD86]|uniref:Uncharacterized protein n=1 Tax=Pseudocercospora fijiensis (strain CIRAD86) TaxID=383855 RepID=N1Q6V6_PSEFD|nr:uncharacterized protein MYCFIDRAFT_209440 [Pseudocercospora fijiensis CIRAD86]EME87171.1 hypothetical protein MYCFIDRAFT_209440 [Pseudocercospora fijiensis CIRAD86]
MADHDISISGWQEAWLERTHPQLFQYCLTLIYTLSAISLFLSIKSLLLTRKCRRELLQNPSSRAATFAACDKKMRGITRCQFLVSSLFCFHTLAIWLVDAGISVFAVWKDVDANPEAYTPQLWLDLGIASISMLGIFIFVFLVFPMLQLLLFSWAFAKFRPTKKQTSCENGTLGAHIPELRTLTTHLAQMWMMAGFLLMAFWPVYFKSPLRLTIAEAIYGSGLAWSHVAMMLNWRSEEIANLEIKPRMSVKDAVLLYGQHGMALPFRKTEEHVLPKFDDEKQALLGDGS